jgi:hypothetical protein
MEWHRMALRKIFQYAPRQFCSVRIHAQKLTSSDAHDRTTRNLGPTVVQYLCVAARPGRAPVADRHTPIPVRAIIR